MGASAREIEREIKQTRERLDANLDELEGRAASKAIRYGRIAAIVLGAAALAGAAFVIYRKTRKPALKNRLDALHDLSSRIKEEFPSVTVRINEEPRSEPTIVGAIAKKVMIPLAGTAARAALERAVRPREDQATRA